MVQVKREYYAGKSNSEGFRWSGLSRVLPLSSCVHLIRTFNFSEPRFILIIKETHSSWSSLPDAS